MSLRKNGLSCALASRSALRFAATAAALGASLLVGASASAAALTQVTAAWNGGTTEPSYISMYEYVPDKVAANPPILVVVHYCGGSASGIFGEAQGGNIISTADSEGFIMVFPQLASSRNCWDVATTASLTHATGTASGGDTKAIVDMVNYEIKTRNANASRVYSIGSSSGAMMTEALLAVYPDVFKGGAEFSGVPAGCWSDQYATSNQWSGPCAGGTNTMTAAAWGALVRGMYPSYPANGFRPRIQLWHGTADTTISPVNQAQAILEWTNVMGLPTNPTTTSTVTISGHSYMRQQWADPTCSSVTQLDAWLESDGPHGTDANMNGQYSLPFMNLSSTPFAATDPQAACSSSTGTGGSSGTGGTTGTGGSTGGGGATGTGGAKGGTTGTGGSSTTGSGGNSGSGGSSSTTGSGGSSSTTGSGGNSGSGGSSSTTGSGGSSNTTGSGGNSGSGGTTVTGSGGSSSSGSAGSTGSGGDSSGTGSGGANGTGSGGDSGTGSGGNTETPAAAPGCSCEVGSAPGANAFALLLAGLFVVMSSRRRTKRSPSA